MKYVFAKKITLTTAQSLLSFNNNKYENYYTSWSDEICTYTYTFRYTHAWWARLALVENSIFSTFSISRKIHVHQHEAVKPWSLLSIDR